MRTLVALRAQRYNRKPLAIGERFDARPRDARLLVAVGMAAEAPDKPVVKTPASRPATKRSYQRRDMTAEAPAAPADDTAAVDAAQPELLPPAVED